MTDMPRLPTQGRMDEFAAQKLLAYIQRVERLESEIAELQDGKSEVFKECKAVGFDTKALKKVIARRRRDKSELEEQDMIEALYEDAVERAEKKCNT